MTRFYQNPITTYFKNNQEFISGLIIGLLMLLMSIRQAVGLPLLLIYLIAIGGLIRPSKEYLVIAGLLTLKIILISIICKNNLGDLNEPNLKEWFRRIIIDLILLMMIFFRLKLGVKNGFYYFCITIFLVDLLCNIHGHIYGVSWNGMPLEIRTGDWIGRSGGIFGHPFYSIDISIIALFSALLLKNRSIAPLVLLSALNLLLAGSQRGILALVLIITLYGLFYLNVKKIYVYLICVAIVATVFVGVSYIAKLHPELLAHSERIFRWSFGYEVLINNLGDINSYLRFNPEVFTPQSSILINSQFYSKILLFFFNAESYYLSEAINYGLVVSLLSIIIFFGVYRINSKLLDYWQKLSGSSNANSPINLEGQNYHNYQILIRTLFALFIFIDGFYGYLIGAATLSFFYANACFEVSNKD